MKNLKLDPKNMPADMVGWVCLGVAWGCISLVYTYTPEGFWLAGGLFTCVALIASIIALTQKKYWAGSIQLLASPPAVLFYVYVFTLMKK